MIEYSVARGAAGLELMMMVMVMKMRRSVRMMMKMASAACYIGGGTCNVAIATAATTTTGSSSNSVIGCRCTAATDGDCHRRAVAWCCGVGQMVGADAQGKSGRVRQLGTARGGDRGGPAVRPALRSTHPTRRRSGRGRRRMRKRFRGIVLQHLAQRMAPLQFHFVIDDTVLEAHGRWALLSSSSRRIA